MKINGIQRPLVDAGTAPQRTAQKGGTDPSTKVAVSSEARKLAEARLPALSDPSKVAMLAKAIAHGDFMVDAERLADRMIQEES